MESNVNMRLIELSNHTGARRIFSPSHTYVVNSGGSESHLTPKQELKDVDGLRGAREGEGGGGSVGCLKRREHREISGDSSCMWLSTGSRIIVAMFALTALCRGEIRNSVHYARTEN